MPKALAIVTVRELSRSPGRTLERVARGERLIVCKNGRPVATLQPLDGLVVQPFSDGELDLSGSPLGDPDQEISKLNEIQTTMLTKWLTNGVLKWGEDDFTPSEVTAAFKDLEMRGLARRTNRGSVLTGRGLILHERLAMRAGEAIGGYAKPRAPEEKD